MLVYEPAVWVRDERPGKPVVAINERRGHTSRGKHQQKVLVVDDDPTIADTVVAILSRNGFRAHAAYDGSKALQMAQKIRPDYVLADVLMPKMNGVEMAIALREMKPDAKIFLFSGQAGVSEIMAEAEKKGHNFPLIPKPIHPEKLLAILRDS